MSRKHSVILATINIFFRMRMRLELIYRRHEYFYARSEPLYAEMEHNMAEMYDVSNRYYPLYAIYDTLHISFVHVLISQKVPMQI